MITQTTLKPCPFCGATAFDDKHDDPQHYRDCRGCGFRFAWYDSGFHQDGEWAFNEAWNRRAA